MQRRIEELKQWEKNSDGKCEIELYWDVAPYSDLPKGHPTDGQASSDSCSITEDRTNPFPKCWNRSTAEAYTHSIKG